MLDYFETHGGPICICDINNLLWDGSNKEDGDYWKAVSIMDSEVGLLLEYAKNSEVYFLLNNENSGFYLLTDNSANLILLEIFFLESDNIMWEELEFTVSNKLNIYLNFTNGCLIFDSNLTLEGLSRKEGFYKINNKFNNYFCDEKSYKNGNRIFIKNKSFHLDGIILYHS